jgi:hypothetical protein
LSATRSPASNSRPTAGATAARNPETGNDKKESNRMAGAIDIWCNIFTPAGLKKYYSDVDEMAVIFVGKLAGNLKGHSPKEFLSVLDAAGVDKVLIPNGKHRSFMTQELHWNMPVEEVAAITRADPKRFIGMYGINPFTRMQGVREMETMSRSKALLHAFLLGFTYRYLCCLTTTRCSANLLNLRLQLFFKAKIEIHLTTFF